MIKDILGKLADPPASFRGTPFWAWNAELDPKEIREQIRVFHKMGLGGFFMHSRTGLGTPYLSKEWFDCIRAAMDEAKKLGLQPWMYDEDRWPSGAAGGIVTKDKRYRPHTINAEVIARAEASDAAKRPDTLAFFAERVAAAGSGLSEKELMEKRIMPSGQDWKAREIISYRKLASATDNLDDGEVLVRYFIGSFGSDSWYNGQTYLDTLNPTAVRKFVQVTHEAYLREFGEDFGKVIPGCFTDEPNFSRRPWTAALPKEFSKRFGYDLIDYLPETMCIVGGEQFSRVRHDYLEIATSLFVKAFSKTIGDWCGKHGLMFTGHALAEDTLSSQTKYVGSAMRFNEYQQAPGIDQLTERWAIYQTAKQCSSVAHQMGRTYRLVEAYGCTGWDFPLEGHKAIGDWLVALGINHRCQHLAWYSMSGEAKRDYPASISRQSPWHGKYKAVEDYFARIGETLSSGEEVIPVLVLHTVESSWGLYVPAPVDADGLGQIDDAFFSVTKKLLGEHLDFDYGDEDQMVRLGRAAGRRIRIGKAKYEAVVLPEMLTIRRSTLDLLAKIASKGGKVLYIGEPPKRVDAVLSNDAVETFKAFTQVTLDALPDELKRVRRISIRQRGHECDQVIYQERATDDGLVVFACNTSAPIPNTAGEQLYSVPWTYERLTTYERAEMRIKAPQKTGDVYEVDLMTGKIFRAPYVYKSGWYRVPCPFGRLASHLFIVTPNNIATTETPVHVVDVTDIALPKAGYDYSLDDDNVLVLDKPAWVANGEKHGKEIVLAIDRELRAKLGKQGRCGHMVQPWYAKVNATADTERTKLDLRLEYTFTCAEIPSTPVALAIENPELYTIEVNGKNITNKSDKWWVDPCLRRIEFPAGTLVKGENKIVLTGKYDESLPGLEAMFLLGNFSVSRDGRIISALPKTVDIGDLCRQGFTNYSGNITYSFKFDAPKSGAIRLAIPRWSGSAIGMKLNGGEERFLPFPPYEAIFTDGLKRDGSDVFEVTVYGHRRNAFGPFYHKGGAKKLWWTGPGEMGQTNDQKRTLVPFGLGCAY